MLAKPELVPQVDWKSLTIDHINAETPPEAIPEPPKQQTQEKNIDRPITLVPTNNASTTIVFPPSLPNDLPTITPTLPPLTPAVEVEASFVRGVEIQPDYPPALARQEIEGFVTVRVLIGTDGRVREVHQVSATDPEFFRATERQALRHWRFRAATRDGIAIESWRQMTVRFKLEA